MPQEIAELRRQTPNFISMSRKNKRRLIGALAVALLIAGGAYLHFSFYSAPAKRLRLGGYYPEMAEDGRHHYIDLPIDYQDPTSGKFRGFYLLRQGARQNMPITFVLTDGQMELISTKPDFSFFDEKLGGTPYVLMSVRGQSPTFFPEVYKNGKADLAMAIRLLSSDQQVEDIEQVRLDLIAKGILQKDAKINVFGASGAGVLAQQYVSKYGKNVNRLLLESTGAPDLSEMLRVGYSPKFASFNPAADSILHKALSLRSMDTAAIANILYQVGRNDKEPKIAQLKIVRSLQKGSWLLPYWLKPTTNLSVINYLVRPPKEIAVRVRWFELVGADLLQYNPRNGINLLDEFSKVILSDFIEFYNTRHLSPRKFMINRDFKGEVLILKGTEDVVFGDSVNSAIQHAYPNAKLLFFKDGHRMQNNIELYRNIRADFLKNGFTALPNKQ